MSETLMARWPIFRTHQAARGCTYVDHSADWYVYGGPGLCAMGATILGNLGIGLCAGAAAAINHVVDERIDQKMSRTTNRPVATGRVSQTEALIFAAFAHGCAACSHGPSTY